MNFCIMDLDNPCNVISDFFMQSNRCIPVSIPSMPTQHSHEKENTTSSVLIDWLSIVPLARQRLPQRGNAAPLSGRRRPPAGCSSGLALAAVPCLSHQLPGYSHLAGVDHKDPSRISCSSSCAADTHRIKRSIHIVAGAGLPWRKRP